MAFTSAPALGACPACVPALTAFDDELLHGTVMNKPLPSQVAFLVIVFNHVNSKLGQLKT